MEVIYTGLHQTPEQIVETAIQEDADAVGVSILSGAHMTLVPRIVDGLRANGADDVLVVVGGTIPPDDADELEGARRGSGLRPGRDDGRDRRLPARRRSGVATRARASRPAEDWLIVQCERDDRHLQVPLEERRFCGVRRRARDGRRARGRRGPLECVEAVERSRRARGRPDARRVLVVHDGRQRPHRLGLRLSPVLAGRQRRRQRRLAVPERRRRQGRGHRVRANPDPGGVPLPIPGGSSGRARAVRRAELRLRGGDLGAASHRIDPRRRVASRRARLARARSRRRRDAGHHVRPPRHVHAGVAAPRGGRLALARPALDRGRGSRRCAHTEAVPLAAPRLDDRDEALRQRPGLRPGSRS